jgi:hypothetical protein
MALFNIWMEGYQCNGDRSDASFLGTYEGKTFNEACDNWAKSNPNRLEDYKPGTDSKRPSYWACGMYDNEADARKSFG